MTYSSTSNGQRMTFALPRKIFIREVLVHERPVLFHLVDASGRRWKQVRQLMRTPP